MTVHLIRLATVMVFFLCLGCVLQDGTIEEGNLHVTSPEWKDQIMYFIVTDRFMDGDTTNNDQGAGEYKKGDNNFWNGGDLKGISQKIDYIKELGATSIWITPPVANQWRNPQHTGTGNHGYWATNFMEVDKHLGTIEDYKALSKKLHNNNMYLIQDVVVNHLGDFYTYDGPYNPEDVTQNFKIHEVDQPTQYPFTQNNALDKEDREMAIFHFAPNFYDHSDLVKKKAYQFADLDDLNTANPVVRDVLRTSYNYWIKEVGVDGYRFDTPHMVEHELWHDFLHSKDSNNPGIIPFSRSLGKEEFMAFGETAFFSHAMDNSEDAKAAEFLGTKERPEMNSILNFPLTMSIDRVFKELKPTNFLTFRLESEQTMFDHPELLLNFIDNHDGARFLSVASRESFRQALLFILTIPGIPIIYYGTEQEFKNNARQAMFKGGAGSPDTDHFNTGNASFKFVQELIQLRKNTPLFKDGKLEIIADQQYGPGVFAYQLSDRDKSYLILFNTSSQDKILANVMPKSGIEGPLELVYSLQSDGSNIQSDQQGALTGILSSKAGLIYECKVKSNSDLVQRKAPIEILTWSGHTSSSITFNGTVKEATSVSACIDGAYEQSVSKAIDQNGQWSFDLQINHLQNGEHDFIVYYQTQEGHLVSASEQFIVNHPIKPLIIYDDPKDDDHGPSNKYTYPKHISFTKQMDIENVKVFSEGTNLKFEVTMGEITQIWLPPNGFDHCLLNIYIDLPGQDGVRFLPNQNAVMPNGGHWDYLLSSGGFGNSMFSSKGANKHENGLVVGPAPQPSVDLEQKTISLTVSAEALGYPSSLAGTKIYITTWDGGTESPRGLSPDGGTWSFGGGEVDEPKIMDDTRVLILR